MTDTTAVSSTTTPDAGNPTTTTDVTAVTPEVSAPDTNAQPADSKPASTDAAKPEVPENYEFKMPEGVAVDKDAADEFTAIAKELKLSQEDAQKVADVGAKMAQRQIEAHTKLVESWVEQVKTDKDIGGDKLAENLAVARKAMEEFGTPELKDVLNSTGFGNHPAVVKAFYKIGLAISQDGFVKGSAPRGAEADIAKRMFPTMN